MQINCSVLIYVRAKQWYLSQLTKNRYLFDWTALKKHGFLFLQFLSELSIFGRYSVILKNLHRLDCFGSLNLRFGFRMCFFFSKDCFSLSFFIFKSRHPSHFQKDPFTLSKLCRTSLGTLLQFL